MAVDGVSFKEGGAEKATRATMRHQTRQTELEQGNAKCVQRRDTECASHLARIWHKASRCAYHDKV